MTGRMLKDARKKLGMKQVEAAAHLGVSQTYYSLLENGKRTITDRLAKRAVKRFNLSPTVLPLNKELNRLRSTTNQGLVKDLASLKYPGYSHVSPSELQNPVTVLYRALMTKDLEARLVEALPWVLFTFSDLQWNTLVAGAKIKDLQNKLGFLNSLAKKLAEQMSDKNKFAEFERREQALEKSRLMKEDTLCYESMGEVERRWLRKNRSPDADHWNILSDLEAKHLTYAK